MTALDLTSRPDGWIRKEMGVGGLKTVRELRGEDCIGFDDMPQPKQTAPAGRRLLSCRPRTCVNGGVKMYRRGGAKVSHGLGGSLSP